MGIIDINYPSGSRLRDIYLRHCESVARLALDINRQRGLGLDEDMVRTAAMLHDIGICRCDAPGIFCTGTEPYIRHGIIGAEMLRQAGYPEYCAAVAERHTGAGLTAAEITAQHLPLPAADYLPRTELEQLICYADKFYSKSGDMNIKPYARVEASMRRFGPDTLARFTALHARFAIPATS